MKPIIGITPSQQKDFSEYRLAKNYVESIVEAGGIPFILPINTNGFIKEYLNKVDGLLLSGGVDPDPFLYNENPRVELGSIDPERDQFEIDLVNEALNRGIPILGICRGCQILNIATGGTLIQDLPTQKEGVFKHWQAAPEWYQTHSVILEEGSILLRLLQKKEVRVNSFHHQAIKLVSSDFVVTARSKDGVIEAIEKKNEGFALGVQWHPEGLWPKDKQFLILFQELIKRALNY